VVHPALVVHPPFVLYHLVWIEEKILLILLSSFPVIAIVVIYTVIVRNSKAHFHHSFCDYEFGRGDIPCRNNG
jgi:hypothetical protein